MSTLSYILLCMLVRKPCSGYELKQYINLFWEAHHSQIYTALNKLHEQGYVSVETDAIHKQKKIYHLTPEGQLVVADWFQEETNVPTQRDEFLAKVYVIALFNQEQATSLLQDRRHHYQKTQKQYQHKMQEYDAITDSIEKQKNLGRYLILKRRLMVCTTELEWCDWAQDILTLNQNK
ncbi:PadR family transcriptional regulator [Latilactobacillus sakei]|uniref:PadR family transcriptional regulator n=2 Tax=Latilactobacillus sakei TaxID=1599 RepID=UPI000340A46B|nr:PadR family transcriptional regulator [Latilactobacillus sakei]ARJ71236.1 PadR family transcriptional regulator [Latilactobacillus sakei]AST83586.1 PadR family transcriptional regulator [Latilactobacillus sakei]AWZ43344.1 PadR family transcriptional regulator [Latilactobacillus sakei]AWZ44256.1 PadR family transcriptional regulator [Latilactobacillus sakei]AWZ45523.1 PadR family transcriptional regulator [Latilactobacillus sakei]